MIAENVVSLKLCPSTNKSFQSTLSFEVRTR